MAQFRYVYTSFWGDPKVSETFTPEDKLTMLYLLTNSHTTQIGVYRITKRVIAFEMGLSIESVNSLIDRFESHHKLIKYNSETRELAIRNWGKFNLNKGGKPIEDCIKQEFTQVEDKELLLYVVNSIKSEKIKQLFIDELVKSGLIKMPEKKPVIDGIVDDTFCDTSTIRGQNENKNENENENKKDNIYNPKEEENNPVDNVDNFEADQSPANSDTIPYRDIVAAYNTICGDMPRVIKLTAERKKAMKTRWKEYKNINVFIELFTKAEASNFLSGRDGKWTGCAFDWLLNSTNMIKVLEGNYDNKANLQRQSGKVSTFNDYKQRPDALKKYKELEQVMESREEIIESADGKAFMDRIRNRAKGEMNGENVRSD